MTNNIFIDRINNYGFKLINCNYKNSITKMNIVDDDGYKYFCSYLILYNCIKRNGKPDKFSNSNPHTINNIKLWIKLNNYNFKLIGGKYSNSKYTLLFKCLKCGESYNCSWNGTLKGRGCPKCGKFHNHKPQKDEKVFLKEIYDLVGSEYRVLEKYMGTEKKILFKHNTCLHEWFVKPSSFLRGTRCPRCKSSKGEKKIINMLNILNINYLHQKRFKDCKYKYPLPFDFYLPDLNICIEYNGEQHFYPRDFAGKGAKWAKEEFDRNMNNYKIKKKYCKDKNIKLIEILYTKFNNIEKILEKAI